MHRNNDNNDDDDDDDDGHAMHADDVPCPCGQQLVGMLLGTLMGYNALLLAGPERPMPVLACLSVGVAVGIAFSAGNTLAALISAPSPSVLCLALSVVCFAVSQVAVLLVGGSGTLFGLLLAAIVTSTATHALLHFYATFGLLLLLRLPCPRAAASGSYAKTCHV